MCTEPLTSPVNSYLTLVDDQSVLHPLVEGQVIKHDEAYAFFTKSFWLTYVADENASIPRGDTLFIEGVNGEQVELFVIDGKIVAKIYKLAVV